MRLQLRYFAAAGLLLFGLAAYGQNEARPESPEGFYFFSTDDVAHIRESAKTDWGGRIVASMRRSVDERLTHDMEVPTMEAGHGHFYVCPIHNVTFTFRWDHPTAHYCAACGREYRGVNRYNWGWVNFVHAHNLTFLTNCMYLYLATGESRYAEYIRDMLLDYSNMYPDYMVHNAWRKPSEAHSGKMFGQSLDESVWFSSAARAYVAVRGTLTGAQQRKIERDLFRQGADLLLRRRDGGNWQVWHNCGLTALAVALRDDGLIRVALDDPQCGYRTLMARHVYADGWWNEGSPIYHFYPLGAVVMTADAVRCRNIDLYDEQLYNMFASPVRGVYPDLTFPAHNDGWYGESLIAQAGLFEAAYARFRDPLFRDVLAQCYRYVERGGGYALLNPERIAPASEPLRQESFRFEDAGFALLRSPEATVVLKYGPHGGGHGHPDKLSISVHDGRKELVSDFGTSAYGAPDYTKWYRKTLAHNTVTVDGRDQSETAGEFVAFESRPDGGMVAARADRAYPGVEMSRRLTLKGAGLSDRFVCRSDGTHRYDYVLLFNERPALNGKSLGAVSFGEEPYARIRNAERYAFKRGFVIRTGDAEVRIDASAPVEVFVGEASGIPPTNPGVKTVSGSEKRPVQPAYPVIVRMTGRTMTIDAQWKINP